MWVQVLLWICIAPIPLVLIALQAPAGRRARWWSVAVAAALLWIAIGASGSQPTEPVSTEVAISITTTTEHIASSPKEETTTTTVATTTSSTTTSSTTTTAPPTTTTAPPPPSTTAAPRHLISTPTTSSPPPTAPPATSPPSSGTVHPGSYCSPVGSHGVSSNGVPMTCVTVGCDGIPYKDGRGHWRRTTC